MPFRQPEYDRAFTELLSRTIDAAIDADPLLSKIQRRRTSGPVELAPDEEQVAEEGFVGGEGVLDAESVRRVDVPASRQVLTDIADSYVDQMRAAVFAGMSAAAEQAGQVTGCPGAPITWNEVLDGFERIDWPADEDGAVREPDVVFRSGGRLEDLGPRTPEQGRRLEAIRARKQAEYDARRRTRRLS